MVHCEKLDWMLAFNKPYFPLPSSLYRLKEKRGFPGGWNSKESTCNVGDLGLTPVLGRSSEGGHGKPLQYSCLENSYGERSTAGYSPWGHKESDTTERLSTALHSRRELFSFQTCEARKSKPATQRSGSSPWVTVALLQVCPWLPWRTTSETGEIHSCKLTLQHLLARKGLCLVESE